MQPDCRFLYLLRDPLDGQIRYVGVSCDPKSRLQFHLARPTSRRMAQWLDSLGRKRQSAALKRAFPGVKFSVRSDSYSMGAPHA